MAKWMMYSKKADFKKMAADYGIDPVVARILVNRDIREPKQIREFLHPSQQGLPDGGEMKDMQLAVDLLQQAIAGGLHIRIIGDYDIDGIQATYILHRGLQRAGAVVDYAIPHRITDGYGVNPEMIRTCREEGVDLVITCDNGIAAREAVAEAKKLGIQVIITDHHEVPYEMCNGEKRYLLPSADAIVDPKQPDCPYPCKKICGAVVAWKLIGCLYPAMGIPRQEAGVFLENAAFATVGDVMELVEENRTIVALGLQQLSRTENPGMATLISRCGLEGRAISAYHVGFVLGPCFNASGRLDTAVRALELLEAENVRTAAPLAQQLQNLNEERKAMTEQGVKAGEAYITDHHLLQDTVLVVYLTGIHESVAGIIAGRLREKYSHPVFVLTDAADGRGLKGSGRSMEGYHMFDEICKCSDLMDKFGGHAMAAGLTLPRENLEAFRQRLNADPPLAPDELQPVIHIDVAMPLGYITKELVLQLEGLEPFGNGNSKPVFAQKDVRVRRRSRIGKNKEYLRMEVQDQSGCTMSALYFGDADALEAILDERGCFDMTYYPQINVFRGQESLQIVIGNVR